MSHIKEKLQNKTAVLGVIGLGYVGLPLAVEKAKAGFSTIGVDILQDRVDQVNQGHNYIGDVVTADLEEIVRSGRLVATTDYAELAEADTICLCVPTPLDKHQQPDTSCIEQSVKALLPYIHEDMLIVLESTTYPGCTEELIKPMIEQTGLVCGRDIYLAFSPERVDPGNDKFKTRNTPKVVGGVTQACTEVAAALYEAILEAPIHRVSSPAVAEMEKILENSYRNINIGLVNELAQLCHKMNINVWEVIDTAATKPYGFQAFYPGPGLGGHCIPLDPYYLSWKAREYGFHTSMIEASMMINDGMPEYTAYRAIKILNRAQARAVNGSRILILGVAYKQDISDVRESPALRVIDQLEERGAEVRFFDPYILSYRDKRGMTRQGEVELTRDLVKWADLVVITTAHTTVDYAFVQQYARNIFDTKNACKAVSDRDNIDLL